MKQTQMYICTLVEFILIDVASLLYNAGVKIIIGNYTGVYIIVTIHEKVSWCSIDTLELIELQLHEKVSLWDLNLWTVIPLFAFCLTPYSVNWYLNWLLTSHIVGETTECYCGN